MGELQALSEKLTNYEVQIKASIQSLLQETTFSGSTEHHQKVKTLLQSHHDTLEVLQILADGQTFEDEKTKAQQRHTRHKTEHEDLRHQLRQAVREASVKREKQSMQEREELLTGSVRERNASADKKSVLRQSSEVTANLRRVRNMMSEELDRTSAVVSTIGTSVPRLVTGSRCFEQGAQGRRRRNLHNRQLAQVHFRAPTLQMPP